MWQADRQDRREQKAESKKYARELNFRAAIVDQPQLHGAALHWLNIAHPQWIHVHWEINSILDRFPSRITAVLEKNHLAWICYGIDHGFVPVHPLKARRRHGRVF